MPPAPGRWHTPGTGSVNEVQRGATEGRGASARRQVVRRGAAAQDPSPPWTCGDIQSNEHDCVYGGRGHGTRARRHWGRGVALATTLLHSRGQCGGAGGRQAGRGRMHAQLLQRRLHGLPRHARGGRAVADERGAARGDGVGKGGGEWTGSGPRTVGRQVHHALPCCGRRARPLAPVQPWPNLLTGRARDWCSACPACGI